MALYMSCVFLLINIYIVHTDMTSYFNLHGTGIDFVPANSVEFYGIHFSVSSTLNCAILCHRDPQCRTFVFDFLSCRLYEGAFQTGSVVASSLNDSIVGSIIDDNINLALNYNQSCDHCYLDRYLVCRNNTCQCPLNTFWDGQNKCINQLFVDSTSSCQSDNWCREDMNLTCQFGKCQCPIQTFWNNETCVSQFVTGAPCNNSNQCRNDLNIICSRTNKTCTLMSIVTIPVINGTLPNKFSNLGINLYPSGNEWWLAFDNKTYTGWNPTGYSGPDYLLITFDNEYLISSLQLTIYGDTWHDAKTIYIYMDENATYLSQSFSFPAINNGSNYLTFAPSSFNTTSNPLVTNQLLLVIYPWGTDQVWLMELTFFGSLY